MPNQTTNSQPKLIDNWYALQLLLSFPLGAEIAVLNINKNNTFQYGQHQVSLVGMATFGMVMFGLTILQRCMKSYDLRVFVSRYGRAKTAAYVTVGFGCLLIGLVGFFLPLDDTNNILGNLNISLWVAALAVTAVLYLVCAICSRSIADS